MLVLCCCAAGITAQRWTTHFAYNNVTQIAMASDRVYALSDGSLYSVDKLSEQIRIYGRQSGLHATGITCIGYDVYRSQLIIAYDFGKLDILTNNGVRYIGDLYNKDMTQRKTVHNITIHGRTAYLSTHYGVQTLDLTENRLVDSYWLRPDGAETPVMDVLINGDSIYAFTTDSLFCASLSDNLVDYHVWQREVRSGRISPDSEKGKHYQDALDNWYAGGAEGIIRFTPTERLSYRPEGPLTNISYRVMTHGEEVYVLPGGRWTNQNNTSGNIMRFDGIHWMCIPRDSIYARTGKPVLDMMNVAVDPQDSSHLFVTSYGTGLYEFQGTQLQHHYLPAADNTLESAVPNNPTHYTRLDNALYDADGNLWLTVAGDVTYPLVCKDRQGVWHGLPIIVNTVAVPIHTPTGLLVDRRNGHHKWLAAGRAGTGLYCIDDRGTWDASDDHICKRSKWLDQQGDEFEPQNIYAVLQDSEGRIWMATEQGIARIDTEDHFSDEDCVRPVLTDNNGENPMRTLSVNALCEDAEGQIWVGTLDLGVYVLNSEATEIVAHYTTDNSALPSNSILSVACTESGGIYVGTAEGLVAYDPQGGKERIESEEEEEELHMGYMQQWRLHLSYAEPQEVVATPGHIYAAANGTLFSVNRQDETIEYWNKATGLTGNRIVHIAYDVASEQLIIAYDDGRIDLLSEDGAVRQMPDLYMKASSMAMNINCIAIGSRYVYLGTTFGILAVNPRKAEIVDTYYIGQEAASVNVQQIVEHNDSLYAFADNRMYSVALKDNLVDYNYWHATPLDGDGLTHACAWRDRLYVLMHDTLYSRSNDMWQQVSPEAVKWIHASGGQLLAYREGVGVLYMGDDNQWHGLAGYSAVDAVYSKGEWWLGISEKGLIRLNSSGDDVFQPEGPNSNFGYRLHATDDHVYVASGGRWAEQFMRYAHLNIYDGAQWRGITPSDIGSRVGRPAIDAVSIAVDPNNAGHFFVATYGTGVFEFNNYEAVAHYTVNNSTLREAVNGIDPNYYTRTDGAMIDEQGNLWVLNATEIGAPVHIRTKNGVWYSLKLTSYGDSLHFVTPGEILVDRRSSQRKWMINQRVSPGIILLDDGGTPTRSSDDRCLMRSSFVDQNGKPLSPDPIYCLAQDHKNRIWVGTQAGVLLIPATTDFFTSNACQRIIIPRNDGTGLGDYLLANEQINCMAVDGGDRMWIGTANSGLYLIEDDTITVAHFTEYNSLLPSNVIQSIAIMPTTGEVFVGTDKGIASYLSDASESRSDFSGAYAYPNPVRPDYDGMISITGLMENTVVNIVDESGNLVCKTRSHGGTAVWDGKSADGHRASAGVYTALCNADGGHTVVKILVIR